MKKGLLLTVCFLFTGSMLLGLPDTASAFDGISRTFLKTGSLLAAGLGIAGIAIAGFLAGKNYDSYTGWERFTHGAGQFFNRKPFQKDSPTYEKTDQHSRLSYTDNLEARIKSIVKLMMPSPDGGKPEWSPDMGMEALPEPLKSYYMKDNAAYSQTLKALQLMKKQRSDWPKWETQFAIADYWSRAFGSLFGVPNTYPEDPKGSPEEWFDVDKTW